ncbi:MAG: hypothetical protein HC882_00850 [Acidobacteria bacterium]|nr:hypothetical protein [Acidobacteriota bacterium]
MKSAIIETLDESIQNLLSDNPSRAEVANTLALVKSEIENLKTIDGDGTEAARIERTTRRVRRQALLECAAHVAEADSIEDARATLERLLLTPKKQVGFVPFADVLSPYKANLESLRKSHTVILEDLERAERHVAELSKALNESEASCLSYAEEAGQAKDLMAQQSQISEAMIASLRENHEQYRKSMSDVLVGLGLVDAARVAEIGLENVLNEMVARKALPPESEEIEPLPPETPETPEAPPVE